MDNTHAARIGDTLPAAILPGMPQRMRLVATGGEPLTAADTARADRLEAEADAQALAEIRQRQADFRRRAWDEALDRAARFRDARFGRLKPQQDPDGRVTAWLDSGSQVLLLPGESRRGKTYAAYAVGNAAFERGMWAAAWYVPDLLRALRPSDLDKGRAERVWEAVTAADLLILDDLGAETGTEWSARTIKDVLDACTRNGRRIAVTTNLGYPDMVEAYGEVAVYRLIETASLVRIEGQVLTPDPLF